MTAHGEREAIDEVTGAETTGHVWDGDLMELNKPLPRWWLYTFYACIAWAFGYWLVYPAWPMLHGYTKGFLGYSQRDEVAKDIAAAKAAQNNYRKTIAATPITDIKKNPELFEFARDGGAAIFGDNCAPCHGRGAQGAVGYPNLNDDDWLWAVISKASRRRSRTGQGQAIPKTHDTAMPRFGIDKILEPAQISDVANYVRSLSHLDVDAAAAFARRRAICRQLRHVSRDRRQRQYRGRGAESDRRHLALRQQPGSGRAQRRDRPRRHDAGVERPLGSRRYQDGRALRSFAWWWKTRAEKDRG